MPRPPSRPRGLSLIELMIAMAVLTVGLLAMWHLHVVGLTSTAAGRRHTIATGLATELVSGLERLAFTDLQIKDASCTGQGAQTWPPPGTCCFGPLVQGDGTILSCAKKWTDGDPARTVPGVRLDADLRDKLDGGARYERRWTVWDVTSPRAPSGAKAGVKLIAVSVVWWDPPFARPREVVLYSQVVNPGALLAGLANSP